MSDIKKVKDNKKVKKNKVIKPKYNYKWVIIITFWTFLLAVIVSLISEGVMRNLHIMGAFVSLIFIIAFGVLFDTIGIAVTASSEKPFHSMASNKVMEANYAIRLIRNAGPVSNFCNDVIGDISGIISGAAGTIIVSKLIIEYGLKEGTILSVLMSSFVASLTVGGKALGKELAIKKSDKIIFYVAKLLHKIDKNFGIDILPKLKKKKNKRKRDV